MLSGLIEAFVAATAYGFATIAQAVGVGRMAMVGPDGGLWQRLRAGWPFGAGLVLDTLGFVASIAALRDLPLFLVESAIASSVGVTAAAAIVILGVHLSRVETIALATMMVGLVLLALSAQPGPARTIDSAARWWLLVGAVAIGVLVWVSTNVTIRRSAAFLATTSGLEFALVGIAARVLDARTPWWRTVADPTVWALVVAGVVGMIAFGLALGRAPATTVAAINFAVETIVPSVVGFWLLGDAVRPHLWVVAALGFAATLAGCVSLARLADAEATLPHHVTPG